MNLKTPLNNLSVVGTLKLDGDAAINGNAVIAGTIVLGQTHITEQIFNELVYAANEPGIPGPQGDCGTPGPPGPAGIFAVPERDNVITSIMGFGNPGDVAYGSQDGNTYLYICYQAGNWGRILLDTNF